MQSLGEGEVFEYTFYISLKNKENQARLVEELNTVPEITDVRFHFDE
jgi:hypothetical protein